MVFAAGVQVERLTNPTDFAFDSSATAPSAYPVSITLQRLSPPKPQREAELRSGLYRSNMFVDDNGSTNGQAGSGETVQAGVGKALVEAPRPENGPANAALNVSTEDVEVVKAKYVVGCDGARSWVRK